MSIEKGVRRKYFMLDIDNHLKLLKGYVRIKNIPDGSKIVFIDFEPVRGCWILVVQHESFEMIPAFSEYPRIVCEFEVVT